MIEISAIEGETYEDIVPDTLDLAERAKLAINGLTRTIEPEHEYETYFLTRFYSNPPYMFHATTGLPTNNPKYAEALPMMRVMSGSNLNLDVEKKMMRAMVSLIDEDGLYYAPAKKERPWHEGVIHVYPRWNEDFANVYGNSRMMLAMMAWYQRDHNPTWMRHIKKIVDRLVEIAIYKEDYAYYPDSMVGEAFSYPKTGWKITNEPLKEHWGAEGSMFMYHGGQIIALTRWYNVTGDKKALELARKLVNFVLKPKFWRDPAPPGIIGSEHAYNRAALTSHMLHALLRFAMATNDSRLKEFVRDGYEYFRKFGLARIGWFGGECLTPRLIELTIKLCDSGVGDYWDDVDQYIRNHMVESQLIRPDLLEKVSKKGPIHEVGVDLRHNYDAEAETTYKVIDRNIGVFGTWSMPTPTQYDEVYSCCCCHGTGARGLYCVWESIIRFKDDTAQVNLLLNRSSPWIDVNSYLPYEGKVVLKNKTATKVFVRIPSWVDKEKVKSQVNGNAISQSWLGNYLLFYNLNEKDVISVKFPMVETTLKYTVGAYPVNWDLADTSVKEYTCHFKGNTLIKIIPSSKYVGYTLYNREYYEKNKTPMKKTNRFVSPIIIEW